MYTQRAVGHGTKPIIQSTDPTAVFIPKTVKKKTKNYLSVHGYIIV